MYLTIIRSMLYNYFKHSTEMQYIYKKEVC